MTLTLTCLNVGAAGLSEEQTQVIRVVDAQQEAVPSAVVQVSSNNPRVADSAGVVRQISTAKDTLEVRVRRIGYLPFVGVAVMGESDSSPR